MKSPYFNEDHETFRETVRQFVENEISPFANEWEKAERIPREIWKKMGEAGLLGINYPEKYGGSAADFPYSIVFLEELCRCQMGGFVAAVGVHQYMATEYIHRFGSEELKEKYLTAAIAGEKIGALAITEPNAGSDVAAIRTTAIREGNNYIINGAKTFITNGVYGDFIVLATKTDPEADTGGITLIVVDRRIKGVTAHKLQKIGWHCSDTAELAFDNVQVPVTQRIGEENMGFYYIMECFQLERLVAAITSVAGSERCLETTLKYIQEREAFDRPIAKFQAIRHRLADLATEIAAARQFTYHTAWLYANGEQAVKECSMAKLLTTELSKKVADTCLQFFGGYGYMNEYPISRMFRDARVGTIVGGTSEIMREIIARLMIDEVEYRPKATRNKPSASLTGHKNIEQKTDIPCPETVDEIFQTLPQRFQPEKARNWETVFHFDISGTNGGQYTVVIKDGKCTVKPGLQGEARCLVKTKDKTYLDIELGRANPQTAFLMGKVKVSNLAEMMQFNKMFRRLTDI